jgi:hypothetical protein
VRAAARRRARRSAFRNAAVRADHLGDALPHLDEAVVRASWADVGAAHERRDVVGARAQALVDLRVERALEP